MAEFGYLLIGGVLWNNVIVTHLLGLYPFLGERPATVTQNGILGLVTTALVVVAVSIKFVLRSLLLAPLGLMYLEHLTLVLVLIVLLAGADRVLRRAPAWMPEHLVLRVALNSAALGVVILSMERTAGPAHTVVAALGLGLGVTVLLVLVEAIEERPETRLLPAWLRGRPLQFMTLGMIALALQGFSGIG